jgi:hypothetical protein
MLCYDLGQYLGPDAFGIKANPGVNCRRLFSPTDVPAGPSLSEFSGRCPACDALYHHTGAKPAAPLVLAAASRQPVQILKVNGASDEEVIGCVKYADCHPAVKHATT